MKPSDSRWAILLVIFDDARMFFQNINEMFYECFKMDKDLEKRFGGSTGGLIITDENSKIILHEYPAPLLS